MAKHARVGSVNAADDMTPVRDQPPRPSPARPKHAAPAKVPRIVGMAVAAVVVLAAGLAAGGFVVTGGLNTATPDRAGVEAPSTPSSSPTESPTTTASAGFPTHPATTSAQSAADTARSAPVGSLAATFMDLPPAPLPETAPGVTEPGILLMAWPASDGSFDVLERIRLVSAVSVLTLRPAPVDRAGRQFASVSATATQVQVSAGDQTVIVPGARSTRPWTCPSRRSIASNSVTGSPASPSAAPRRTTGRALAAIGPLTGGVDDDLPGSVHGCRSHRPRTELPAASALAAVLREPRSDGGLRARTAMAAGPDHGAVQRAAGLTHAVGPAVDELPCRPVGFRRGGGIDTLRVSCSPAVCLFVGRRRYCASLSARPPLGSGPSRVWS